MKKFFLLLTVLACFGFAKGQKVLLYGVEIEQQINFYTEYELDSIFSDASLYYNLPFAMFTINNTTQDWQIGTILKYDFSLNGKDLLITMQDTLVAPLLQNDTTPMGIFAMQFFYDSVLKQLPETNNLCVTITEINGSAVSGNPGCVSITFDYVGSKYYFPDDARLSNITVSGGPLTPAFNSNTLNYTINVPNPIASIDISATTKNPNAVVAGTGTQPLVVGQNVFNIVVTAEDGITTKTYIITVNRADENGNAINLTDLESIILFPNPAYDNITIDNAESANVSVYNIAGQQLINVPALGSSSERIDVSNLAAGIYVVKVQNGSTIKTEKIQITK